MEIENGLLGMPSITSLVYALYLGIDLQVDGRKIDILGQIEFRLPKKVSTRERFKDFLVIAFENGRIEIRNFNNPEVVNAIGYTSKNPDHLIVVPRPEGTFIAASSDELRW